MKKLTQIIFLVIVSSILLYAQNEIEKMPEIKDGMQELIKNVKYPTSAKENGIEGTVFVKAVIDEEGNVESASIAKSADKDLDAAAIEAVKNTKFIPGENENEKVKAEVTIPIKFKLDDCKKDKKES